MVRMLISRTQTTTLHKIKAHINIGGNDQANALAKQGCELDHIDAATHMNTRTLYHTTYKKTGGIPRKKHLTKGP
jgi:hypothetical protein